MMQPSTTRSRRWRPCPASTPRSGCGRFTLLVLVLNVLAAIVAVWANWPAQFGGVGKDAGDELLTRGTAISAPLVPVVLMLLVALLAARRDRWSWVGIVLAYATAVTVGIGGVGEMAAEPTPDTSRAVLVIAGVAWLVVAAIFVGLATAAVLSRRSGGDARLPDL